MKMLTRYNNMVSEGSIEDDSVQRSLITDFQRVIDGLKRQRMLWFLGSFQKSVKGLYLSGPVGAGKTFLMDLFYDVISEPRKMRLHLHQFMQQIDTRLREIQGEPEPLKKIATELAKKTRLICFDEFVVADIATAMILVQLLKLLFDKGVVLVATSNTKPDDLYLDGLHRERFLPAIALLNQFCSVSELKDTHDYRLGHERIEDAYLYPHTPGAVKKLKQQFSTFATAPVKTTALLIQNREIPCIKHAGRVVWFDFSVICNLPRSQLDYLEIAKQFDVVFVSDIPEMGVDDTVFALLLIHFIDVMYDQGIRVIISAAVPIDALYTDGEMKHVFPRTRSRLHEMQSVAYLEKHQHF